jgi:hypothetical protein
VSGDAKAGARAATDANNIRHGNNTTYGNNCGRANATTNGCGASMLGIAWTEAVQSSGKVPFRSVLANTDNNNNSLYGNKAMHNDNISATMPPRATTSLQVVPHLGRCQRKKGNDTSAITAKMPVQQ